MDRRQPTGKIFAGKSSYESESPSTSFVVSATEKMLVPGSQTESPSSLTEQPKTVDSTHQDVQYESLESMYHLKHFVARRESPWKVDGESTGVSAKLKLLEQELLSFEIIGKSDLSKVPSLMRKQAKRYQALSGKIDDLCQRMQASDPGEPTLSPEFRTQRQTESLLEAFRLQQRASETGQKLIALQTETGKSYFVDELEGQAKLTTRRCMESIRNSFKEIQRNLEIWLARIIGDVEGILSKRRGLAHKRVLFFLGTHLFNNARNYWLGRWDDDLIN